MFDDSLDLAMLERNKRRNLNMLTEHMKFTLDSSVSQPYSPIVMNCENDIREKHSVETCASQNHIDRNVILPNDCRGKNVYLPPKKTGEVHYTSDSTDKHCLPTMNSSLINLCGVEPAALSQVNFNEEPFVTENQFQSEQVANVKEIISYSEISNLDMELANYIPPLSVNSHIPIIGSTSVISYDKNPLDYSEIYHDKSPLDYSEIYHEGVINKKAYRRQAYFRWKQKKLRGKSRSIGPYDKSPLEYSEIYHGEVINKKEYRRLAYFRWKNKRLRAKSKSIASTNIIENRTSIMIVNECSSAVDVQRTSRSHSKHRRSSLKKTQPGRGCKTGRALLDIIPDKADILPRQLDCPHCGAKKFFSETAYFCCQDGEVILAQNKIPDIFKELLTSSSQEAQSFRALIRTYNNHFGFTSFGVKADLTLSKRNKGIYTFRIQGQIYHFLNDFNSTNDHSNNLQLYFNDFETEVSNRLAACPRLSESVIRKIMQVLESNPYAKFFRNLREVPNLDNYYIVLKTLPGVDQRVYNRPTTSQVAGLWVEGQENGETGRRDIRVHTHSGASKNIQYYYGCYDPLQYPILFPFGDLGWHQGIPKKGAKVYGRKRKKKQPVADLISPANAATAEQLIQNEEHAMENIHEDPNFVSLREYYCYKLQIRDNDESWLLHFARLLQQYIVDQYVKLETQRLDFYRLQQEEIRREFLKGIIDALGSGESQASNVGQRIILPPSFIGGPRNMRRKYMDAMTLVQKYGKPDIFLTMTCNPNWPEIKEHLIDKEEAQNRPDLLARVFHAKLEQLRDELLKKCIFGEVAAYTYVIEYQKRGLPHAHFLLILKSKFKMYTPEEYDKIVCAEIPNKEKNEHLYNLVIKHMLHGPCGSLDPTNVCMRKNGTCKNNFPKNFCEETIQTLNAYPEYRRRDDGVQIKIKSTLLDNRWVVPYNPYLLAKFDCHLNVEICSTIKAVKYIYKYIYKGHDRTSFSVVNNKSDSEIDEIKQYVSARWVSPPEAAWRIFRFCMSEIKPPIIHLQLHLENYQPMSFKKTANLQNVVDNYHLKKTMLTEFFYMNRTDKAAQDLNCTYVEFPDHFVWLPKQKYWKLRERGESIGRIMTAHPSEGERYYLRLLLSKVRCPISFDDLRTFNGVQVETFQEAALIRGLLQNDNSQEICLQEASLFHMPYEMRRLFATLLVYSCPNDPKALWQNFESSMSEDFAKCSAMTSTQVKRNVLQQIDGFLQSMGKSIHLYNLIPIGFSYENIDNETRELRAERNIVISDIDLNSIELLNEKQKKAFVVISERIYSDRPGVFFIDGPGGTGKTFLYRALLADVRSKGYLALATATSGIAASILPGGRTAHSRFKIPIDIFDGATCRVSKQTSLAAMIKEAKLIIWDEAPMAKKAAIEALDDLLRDLMNSEEIFGGKVVVLGGDFRQTLPVVRKGTKAEMINACLINSPLWHKLEKLQLIENMRAKLDPSFTQFLLRIGDGTQETNENDIVKLPSSIIVNYNNETDAIEKLINIVYPEFKDPSNKLYCSQNRAILTTKNNFVDEINDQLIKKFPGDLTEYLSYDETLNENHQSEYIDLLNTLTPSNLPPHRLLLKSNAPIILLRNLDPAEGLCNGTRLIIKSLSKNVICAKIAVATK
ncbi:uncharacterized protein [Coffea arabica]|uniref:ATP-dependent DNA helicase n=1 Tax=Coffea arabica TaxID=13443 RepID=A0ABM4V317_COFAR